MALSFFRKRTGRRGLAVPYLLACLGVPALFLVLVEPMSAEGLTATGNQLWTQDSPGVQDTAEEGDNLGTAVAVGDFNGDGFADLAIGVPQEGVGSNHAAGAVNILYGSSVGLTASGDQFWAQDSDGVTGVGESDDKFGWSIVAGDFDGDGYDDLAIGVSLEGVGNAHAAGAVNILYGSPAGLTAGGSQTWHQDSAGIKGESEEWDGFGRALAAGDFDNDGYDDLAVGIPQEDIGPCGDSWIDDTSGCDVGAVQVLYGGAAGLTTRDQLWSQGSDGVKGASEEADNFGSSLAAGDFDDDGYADLAIGVSGEDGDTCVRNGLGEFGECDIGAVQVLYGGAGGLSARDQLWTQGSEGIKGAAEQDDAFGSSLAAGDFDGDGVDDLAIGVPNEDFFSSLDGAVKNDDAVGHTGAVNVLYGGPSGLTSRDQIWHRGLPGIKGDFFNPNVEMRFGHALTAGDFDGDGHDDLAIGAPFDSIAGVDIYDMSRYYTGNVTVLYGSGSGLTTRDQLWSQDTAGVLGSSEKDDHFGWSLAAGDFNGDGRDDLAIGVRDEDLGAENEGAVQVLYAEVAPNTPPDADAGREWTVVANPGGTADVTLDGSGSSDPDDNPLTYTWTWIGGSASGATPTVTFATGTYLITLTVDDGKGGTNEDTTNVEVLASGPGIVSLHLAFGEQPGASTVGEELDPRPVVWLVDDEGSLQLTFNGPVTLTLLDGSACGGTLAGTLTVNAVNGVAVFDGLSIDTACLDYVLQAASPGLTTAESDPFGVLSAGAVLVAQAAMVPASMCDPGGDVVLTVRLDNVSPDLEVTVTSLTDSEWGSLAGVGTCGVPQALPPGGSYVCSFARSITEAGGFSQSHTVNAAGTDSAEGAVSADDAFPLLVHPLPVLAIGPGPMARFCTGGSTTLDAGAGYDNYLWSTGETTQTISVSASGAYSVTVTDSNGCVATSEAVTAVVVPLPEPEITSTSAFPVCPGSTVELDAGAGYAGYLWSPGGETTRAITVTPTESTSYTVTVTDDSGCTGSVDFMVPVLQPGPQLEATPMGLDFGLVSPGAGSVLTVTVMNVNCAETEILVDLVGMGGFALIENGCQGLSIGPSESCEVSVRFASSGRGTSTGELLLRLASQPDAEPLRVQLLANGLAVPVPAGSALTWLVLSALLALVALRRLN